MPKLQPLCKRYPAGESVWGNSLETSRITYLAAVKVAELPRPSRRASRVVIHGYAVGFGQWFFFPALEPATAFGRAARMSDSCGGYGVYEAAQERQFCDLHSSAQDEMVLLIRMHDGWTLQSDEEELATLKRFVQGVKECPWSSNWQKPTGYLTNYNHGSPVKTSRPSLPL